MVQGIRSLTDAKYEMQRDESKTKMHHTLCLGFGVGWGKDAATHESACIADPPRS